MSEKKPAADAAATPEESINTIEELQKKHQVSRAILEGMKAANDWRSGRQVAETEFLNARDSFLNAPADGRRTKK